jgi:hypothetical protein
VGAAVATVRDTLARSAPLDDVLVVQDARLDPDRLESLIRAQADRIVPGAGLSEPAQAQYDRMLQVACA